MRKTDLFASHKQIISMEVYAENLKDPQWKFEKGTDLGSI